jgi:hypothetical protein
MNWITVVWSMVAAACLTLAAMHLVVWLKQRDAWGHLLLACSAVSVAVVAGFELATMHARTPAMYGVLVRWAIPPIFVLTVSLVFFIRVYLRAGRVWLAWTVVAARALVVILNFIFTPNLHFRRITSLRHLQLFGGETVAIPEGEKNPWTVVAPLSLLLMVIFVLDAMISV